MLPVSLRVRKHTHDHEPEAPLMEPIAFSWFIKPGNDTKAPR